MAEYYLISQLPSLDAVSDTGPLPITWERFSQLCGELLGQKAQEALAQLRLVPPRDLPESRTAFVNAWNEQEQALRLALAKVRAERMGKQFDTQGALLNAELLRVAGEAVQLDPMEAETYLHRYRLAFLESLRPMDPFALDYVFYYGLRLRLLLRMRGFDTNAGAAAYRNIYGSILSGERTEGEQ